MAGSLNHPNVFAARGPGGLSSAFSESIHTGCGFSRSSRGEGFDVPGSPWTQAHQELTTLNAFSPPLGRPSDIGGLIDPAFSLDRLRRARPHLPVATATPAATAQAIHLLPICHLAVPSTHPDTRNVDALCARGGQFWSSPVPIPRQIAADFPDRRSTKPTCRTSRATGEPAVAQRTRQRRGAAHAVGRFGTFGRPRELGNHPLQVGGTRKPSPDVYADVEEFDDLLTGSRDRRRGSRPERRSTSKAPDTSRRDWVPERLPARSARTHRDGRKRSTVRITRSRRPCSGVRERRVVVGTERRRAPFGRPCIIGCLRCSGRYAPSAIWQDGLASGAVRRYYNPELSWEGIERLEWENWVVLMTMQAFLHSVSPHVLAISRSATSQPNADVTVHGALREHSEEGEIDVEEGAFSIEAMLDGRVRCQARGRNWSHTRSVAATSVSLGLRGAVRSRTECPIRRRRRVRVARLNIAITTVRERRICAATACWVCLVHALSVVARRCCPVEGDGEGATPTSRELRSVVAAER